MAPQYPVQPKRRSLRERLKAKVGPKPLVVSYARTSPESITVHPNGEYSLFTQGYHTPTTFAVHREITGNSPNRVRGQTMFNGRPFEEGVRFNPNEDIDPVPLNRTGDTRYGY